MGEWCLFAPAPLLVKAAMVGWWKFGPVGHHVKAQMDGL